MRIWSDNRYRFNISVDFIASANTDQFTEPEYFDWVEFRAQLVSRTNVIRAGTALPYPHRCNDRTGSVAEERKM